MPRWYECPDCGGLTMTGWKDQDGQDTSCARPQTGAIRHDRLRVCDCPRRPGSDPTTRQRMPRGGLRPPRCNRHGDIGTNSPAASNCRVGGAGAGGASRAESLRCLVDHCGLDHSGARRVGAGDRSADPHQGWQDHAPRSAYAYTLCRDGWISHSQGPGTCSWHSGVGQYVHIQVTAPPSGWSSLEGRP